jgi:hypothetical protein
MSLATFQTGTGTAAAARSDIAAELRRWIYQDEDERKRELLETNEAKRQAAAQRAMREALAEQQESIDKNNERIAMQRAAVAKLESEQVVQEAMLTEVIASKNLAAEERLRAQALKLRLSVSQERSEAAASQAEAVTRRAQLKRMKEEAKTAKADEAMRQRHIQRHNAQIKAQKEQLNAIASSRKRVDAQQATLQKNVESLAEAEHELQAAIAAKDEAAQKRIRDQQASLAHETAEKREELEFALIEAEARRVEMVQQAKERILQESEESERRRVAAGRRAAVLAEAEQREVILRNEKKRKAWEAELAAVNIRKLHEESELKRAVARKDTAAQERIRLHSEQIAQDIQDRIDRIEEAASALRERRELLEHDERERRQRAAEDKERLRFTAARRAEAIMAAENLINAAENRLRSRKNAREKARIEAKKTMLERQIADAVAAKDEASERRLRETSAAIEEHLVERARAVAAERKEVEERRVAQAQSEQARLEADAAETERVRVASARRAAATKEKEQMDLIMQHRKKDARAQERIASIEAIRSEKEESWKQKRRKNSILGHQRVDAMREKATNKAQSKADSKARKMEAAAQRKADLERGGILRRAEQARKTAEKEMKARERLESMGRGASQKMPSRQKDIVIPVSDSAATRIQTLHRGRIGRRKSIALKAEKKRKEAQSALSKQKQQRQTSEWANQLMSRKQLKAPGLAVMSVEAEDSAAQRIQKIQRGRQGRRQSVKKRDSKRRHDRAAVKVQKMQRGRADRKRVHQVKETKFAAATKIQSRARGNIIRKQDAPVTIVASPHNQKRSASKPVAPLGSPLSSTKEGVSRGARVIEASERRYS